MSWGAVILAAGRGRRMGGPKASLEMGGATLLELQLRALRDASGIAVVVSVDSWEDHLGPNRSPQIEFIPNPRVEEGPFTSIRLGLEALDGNASALIVPVDCPVPPEAPALLSRAAAPGLIWVAPIWEGRRGHPVLLTAAGRVAALDANPETTLRELLEGTPGAEVPVASPLVHCNLNTPSDRERFLRDHPSWPDPRKEEEP
jgi:molybdenum cofactor cytidylyltransferase